MRRSLESACLCLCLGAPLLGVHGTSLASDADELAALDLADQAAVITPDKARDWQLLLVGAAGSNDRREPGVSGNPRRWSLDLRVKHAWNQGVQAVLAAQRDAYSSDGAIPASTVNTLKEAYLSVKVVDEHRIDLGRVNVVNGVGLSYNPTDFLRVGSVKAINSVDPASLKRDRQGSSMLRGQWIDSQQAISLALVELPEGLGSAERLQLGAPGRRQAWLATWDRRFALDTSVQVLMFKQKGDFTRWGLNLSQLVSTKWVGYLEGAFGRSSCLSVEALGYQACSGHDAQFALGATYSAPARVTLTMELVGHNHAPRAKEWAGLVRNNPLLYGAFRLALFGGQEMASRRETVVHLNWKDALVVKHDLSFMQRRSLDDRSRQWWIESRWHLHDQWEAALQWQLNEGAAGTVYGSMLLYRALSVQLGYYF